MASETQREGIVVLGVPRSGTTLVRRLLNAHSQIACPGETNVFAACARFLAEDRGAEGLPVGVLSGLAFAGFPEEETVRRLRELAFGFHRDHARRAGKPRWAEKSAFDAFHVEAIERLCGDQVHYVCIVRHGLDVVCSLTDFCARSQGYLHEIHAYVRRSSRPHVAFANLWVEITAALQGLAARRPGQTTWLRYEDLVRAPEEELRRLLDGIGVAFEPEMLARAFADPGVAGFGDWKTIATQGVEATRAGRFDELPQGIQEELAPRVNPTLRACGYEPIAEAEPRGPDELRRRYELGLRLQGMKRGDPPP